MDFVCWYFQSKDKNQPYLYTGRSKKSTWNVVSHKVLWCRWSRENGSCQHCCTSKFFSVWRILDTNSNFSLCWKQYKIFLHYLSIYIQIGKVIKKLSTNHLRNRLKANSRNTFSNINLVITVNSMFWFGLAWEFGERNDKMVSGDTEEQSNCYSGAQVSS